MATTTQITTGKARFSYCNLFTPPRRSGGRPGEVQRHAADPQERQGHR